MRERDVRGQASAYQKLAKIIEGIMVIHLV